MGRAGKVDWRTLPRDLSAGRLAPVYFLHGPEIFLKQDALNKIRQAIFGEASGDQIVWNFTQMEAGSSSLRDILDAARTLPMMGGRRMVVVKEAEKLKGPDPEPLKEYLSHPEPTCCLVFITATGKPDLRRSLFRLLNSGASSIEFKPLRSPAVQRWIRDQVKEAGATIEEEALALMEIHLGTDLLRIAQELQKVLDYLHPEKQIGLSALEATMGSGVTGSVFEFAERAAAGEVGKTMALLRRIVSEGEEPARLLFLLTRQIRLLVVGKGLTDGGLRGRELALRLGIPPIRPIIEKVERQIAQFPDQAGSAALRVLLQADRAIKGGRGKGATVLEGAILTLGEILSSSAPRTSRSSRPGGSPV